LRLNGAEAAESVQDENISLNILRVAAWWKNPKACRERNSRCDYPGVFTFLLIDNWSKMFVVIC